jgi:hypothetical protein
MLGKLQLIVLDDACVTNCVPSWATAAYLLWNAKADILRRP